MTIEAMATARRWGVPGIVDAEAPFDPDSVRGATHIAFSMQGLSAYAPDTTHPEFAGKTFTLVSPGSGASGHAWRGWC